MSNTNICWLLWVLHALNWWHFSVSRHSNPQQEWYDVSLRALKSSLYRISITCSGLLDRFRFFGLLHAVAFSFTDSYITIAVSHFVCSFECLLSALIYLKSLQLVVQTTRLFTSWDRSKLNDVFSTKSWHEIARPQVHGHDLNCLAILRGTGNHGYVSGAEEKVARVFQAPLSFLDSIQHSAEIVTAGQETVRRDDVKILGANMSALGLSQKPIYSQGLFLNTPF